MRLLALLVVCASATQQHLNERSAKVGSDIACGMCEFIAEDLWRTLVTDWASDSRNGELARSAPHRVSREMLEQLCVDRSPMLPHLVDMYDIQQCENAAVQACRKAGREWFIKREGTPTLVSAADLEKEMSSDYQTALASVIASVLKGDSSLATALTDRLGVKEVADQDALSELMDAAMASDGELDPEETGQLQALVNTALENRAIERASQRPPAPPREKSNEEREWHLAAYKSVCATHLRGAQVELTDAIGEQFSVHKNALRSLGGPLTQAELAIASSQIEAIVNAGKSAVSAGACSDVCDDADRKLRANLKKRKRGNKKRAKDSKISSKSKRSEL